MENVFIIETCEIKVIQEKEKIAGKSILYTSDNNSYVSDDVVFIDKNKNLDLKKLLGFSSYKIKNFFNRKLKNHVLNKKSNHNKFWVVGSEENLNFWKKIHKKALEKKLNYVN